MITPGRGVVPLLVVLLTAGLMACGIAMGRHTAKGSRPAPYPMAYLGANPGFNVQLARHSNDVLAVLDTRSADAHDAARRNLWLDTRVFVPLYVMLLALTLVVATRGNCVAPRRITNLFFGVLLLAGVMDVLENTAISGAIDTLASGRPLDSVVMIQVTAMVKWICLSIVLIVAGSLLMLDGRRVRRACGVLSVAIGLAMSVMLLFRAVDPFTFPSAS